MGETEALSQASINSLYDDEFREKPADIEEFLFDDEYLGQSLGGGLAPKDGSLYPFWYEKLVEIFNRPGLTEVILTGPIGLGKSTVAGIGNLYMLHNLLCLKNPQEYYGNIASKTIKIFVFSITEDTAHGTIYQTMQDMMLNSPWFKRQGQVRESVKRKWLEFPDRNIEIALGSPFKQGEGQVGEDIFGGCFPGTTKFMTSEGKWEQFQDRVGEEVKVRAVDRDNHNLMEATARVVITGREEVMKINLENGRSIHATEDQVFLVEDTKDDSITEKAVRDLDPSRDRIVKQEVA